LRPGRSPQSQTRQSVQAACAGSKTSDRLFASGQRRQRICCRVGNRRGVTLTNCALDVRTVLHQETRSIQRSNSAHVRQNATVSNPSALAACGIFSADASQTYERPRRGHDPERISARPTPRPACLGRKDGVFHRVCIADSTDWS
jgi:hypothetical protein